MHIKVVGRRVHINEILHATTHTIEDLPRLLEEIQQLSSSLTAGARKVFEQQQKVKTTILNIKHLMKEQTIL